MKESEKCMGSKRAKRTKRQEQLMSCDPNAVQQGLPVTEEPEEAPKKKRLPGERMLRISGLLLLLGGALSAVLTYFALNKVHEMSAQAFEALTAAAGQTPGLYLMGVVLSSIVALFQFVFGFAIWRNCDNAKFAKTDIWLGIIMAAINAAVQGYMISQSTGAEQWTTLIYGCMIPAFFIYGGYKNLKYLKEHPDYVPPVKPKLF